MYITCGYFRLKTQTQCSVIGINSGDMRLSIYVVMQYKMLSYRRETALHGAL